jgi:RND family efflux transporter MFP subunit
MSENIEIGAPVPGLVMEVKAKVWQRVTKDHELFRLDDRDLRAQLEVQHARIRVSEASLERVRDQLSRLKSVSDPRAVSVEDVRTRENDVAVAQAQLKAAQAEAEQTRILMERLTIRAPKDGSILQVNIRPGEYVSLTPKEPAMVLGDLDVLQIRADVDEQNAPLVQTGRPATAYLKGNTAIAIPLKFVRIEPMVIPKQSLTGTSSERVDTRVLQVIYSFDQNKDRPIYVGQQVDVFIEMVSAPAPSAIPHK